MNRAQKNAYRHDYARAKAEGVPFFPHAVVRDLIVATVVVGIIIFLAIWARVDVGPEIDVTTEAYVPRPEWYFLFLFQLLTVFRNQNALQPVIAATFLVPNILFGLLVLWPFLDRGPERRIWKRPISMVVAVLTIVFLAHTTYRAGVEAVKPRGPGIPGPSIPPVDPDARAGLQLLEDSGCYSCHAIGGLGGAVGPDLTDVGTKRRGIQWHIDHLRDPPSRVPGSTMPPFANLTDEQLRQLATLLDGLGTKYKPGDP